MRESRLIGRNPHLEYVQQQLYHCLSGQPRVLLIEGLAGIGKTRLLEEAQAMAEQQGMRTYRGSCDETLTEPYEPFAGLLPRLEDEQVLAHHDVALLHCLFGVSVQTQPTPVLDVARRQDHVRGLMAVSQALMRLAEDQSDVVIVDNLHAADQPSLDLFVHLATTLAEQRTAPILLVASYRPVAPDTSVGRLLTRVQREAITHKLELSGLEEPETRALLQQLGVTRPTHQLVQAIHTATHGIPLFIQEAVHHAVRTGALYTQGGYLAVRQHAVASLAIPQDISETIAARIDALPEYCQSVLTRASLLGDVIPADRLTHFEAAPATTEAALEVAVQQGIYAGANRSILSIAWFGSVYRTPEPTATPAFASRYCSGPRPLRCGSPNVARA